jgi:hypothetical protein
MTKPSQKRDNNYFLARLRDEHPAVYADLMAGKFKNETEALIIAGLRKQRSAMELLKSAWAKATTSECDVFKAFIGCGTPAPAPIPAGIPTGSIVNIATPRGSFTSALPAIHSE